VEAAEGTLMTPTRKRALRILREFPGLTPRAFGKLMWPDNPNWSAHTKCGPRGTSYGGGMNLAAGGFLGRLRMDGLVEVHHDRHGISSHRLSTRGCQALEEESEHEG